MKDIIIIGAGGMGRETAWLIEQINKEKKIWNILGFIDDNMELKEKKIGCYEVLGDIEYAKRLSEDLYFIIAIGNGELREKVVKQLGNKKYATLIHPNVNIADSSKIGKGTIICSGALVSIDTEIGKHCIINFNSIVAHDSFIDDYVTIHVNVNISGNVKIGKYTIVGSGSSIYQGKRVGEHCVIGIGSSVLKKIKDNQTALGVPAEIY